jgi:glycogen(starch) synthase
VRRAAQGPLPDGFPRDGAPVVVFSGRLEIRKGVHHLVPAMHHVWDSLPDAHLVLMGRDGDWRGGRMSDHLRELAGDRAGRLHVLGLQPLDRVYAGLRAADVVALPSLWENFALAAVEALCVGRPIVATTGSGYHDFIADGVEGVLVPPGRVEPLADALLRLLGDEELRSRMAIAAAARGDELDADRVAARYAEFLAEVAGR